MTLQALINKQDNFEIVRAMIASILATETAAQQVLATNATLNPALWAFRVFEERTNPWAEFVDPPEDSLNAPPLVNVTYNGSTFDRSKGNAVSRQHADMTFYLDVYGLGMARDDGDDDGGHITSDVDSALNVHRVVRLVRNILMASEYAHLNLRGMVGARWISQVEMFQPQIDNQAIQRVVACRITLDVLALELAPQYDGVPLDAVLITAKRGLDGQVIFRAEYDETEETDS